MNNWWKKAFLSEAFLFVTFVVVALGIQGIKESSRATAMNALADTRRVIMLRQTSSLASESTHEDTNIGASWNSPVLLVQNPPACQQLKSEYQEVYAFETENFYINVCQLEQNYFYHRQSKSDPSDTLLIPAKTVFGGAVFEAVDGKTTYFVGTDYNGYYSSVMTNNSEIIVEPEINSSSNALQRDDKSQPSSSLNSINPESKNTKIKPQTCLQDRLVLNPLVDDWQNLGDRSIEHHDSTVPINSLTFNYDNSLFSSSLVQKNSRTTTINYKIAPMEEKLSQFCLNSVADGEIEQLSGDN